MLPSFCLFIAIIMLQSHVCPVLSLENGSTISGLKTFNPQEKYAWGAQDVQQIYATALVRRALDQVASDQENNHSSASKNFESVLKIIKLQWQKKYVKLKEIMNEGKHVFSFLKPETFQAYTKRVNNFRKTTKKDKILKSNRIFKAAVDAGEQERKDPKLINSKEILAQLREKRYRQVADVNDNYSKLIEATEEWIRQNPSDHEFLIPSVNLWANTKGSWKSRRRKVSDNERKRRAMSQD